MKAKEALLLLVLVSVGFSAFGPSSLMIERDWVIHANNGTNIDFQGALAMNDTHQQVIPMTLSPGLTAQPNASGSILVHYNGTMKGDMLLLNATATVDVDYGTSLAADPPLSGTNLSSTALTESDAGMVALAEQLSQQNSSLTTIKNLVNWVHSAVQYNTSYWGKTVSAEDTFRTREGVCVEYTQLLIALSRSLGFDTRYISGYVYSDGWQPHAWADIYVPGYGWLPADATFGQVGMLDGTHLAIAEGMNQASVYDAALRSNGNASLAVQDHVTEVYLSNDSRNVSVSINPDNSTYVVTVDIINNRPEYVFGSYQFLSDPAYGQQESDVLLLQPKEVLQRQYLLNQSDFQAGYTYTVPLYAAFNDAQDEKNLTISNPVPGSQVQPQSCALPAFLVLLPIVLLPFYGIHNAVGLF
jgi:hypothetical protein